MDHLDVNVLVREEFSVLALDGELDMSTAEQVRGAFLRLVGDIKPRMVVVDLAGLRFLDSTGLGLLVGMHRRLASLGGQVVVTNVSRIIGRPITVTGLDAALCVHWRDGDPVYPWLDPGADLSSICRTLGFLVGDDGLCSRAAEDDPEPASA